jgi:hypothetical protein
MQFDGRKVALGLNMYVFPISVLWKWIILMDLLMMQNNTDGCRVQSSGV